MLTKHLRKFNHYYAVFSLDAKKNIRLIISLIALFHTAIPNKIEHHTDKALNRKETPSAIYYERQPGCYKIRVIVRVVGYLGQIFR